MENKEALVPDDERIKKREIEELFKKLDVNNDGVLDADELKQGLQKLGHKTNTKEVERLLGRVDSDGNQQVDIREFIKYVGDHEKKLWLTFKDVDKNDDGLIDEDELKRLFSSLGLKLSHQEAKRLMSSMDTDGKIEINFSEWREFLLLNPDENIRAIVNWWRHSLGIDIGDNVIVPDDFSDEEKVTGMWWRQLVAGAAAGAVSRTCTAPLDRLKILLQVEGARQNLNIVTGFKKMLKEGGARSLWRGNGVNVIKIAPESAIKFFAYEYIKKWFADDQGALSVGRRLLAGSSAGVIAQVSIYPMEVLKTRLALATTGQYSSLADAAVKIARQEGAVGLYRGITPSLLGIIPYAGIDLTVYELLKQRWLTSHDSQNKPGTVVLLGCGAVSSTCGQLASYPLALVRTRLQAVDKISAIKLGHPTTMAGVFGQIIKQEGPRGLYRGLAPNFMKVLPAVSISYAVYEKCKDLLGVK
ncbi:mitochondrial adenyl nucleotide antiporter SLC25A24-B-like [Sycon ciliatum]|uniref:mitochondrial adenyl nucleotide antiporter SLC25A24-B-like n=1 Tax=Sycon ciliatum TaxID=27933 RepID=UPI0020AE2273|eukprot:scpid53060/ scgid34153/ Calcium-binding mitochondrial carrier protein SCaMC-1-B; Small calcium-binding mitochondrial carrier protein 1-B; Solute carrier family 25 member 24-B